MKKTEIEKLLHEACNYMQTVDSVDVSSTSFPGTVYTLEKQEIDAMGITLALCGHLVAGNIKPEGATHLVNALFGIYAQSVNDSQESEGRKTCKGCKND